MDRNILLTYRHKEGYHTFEWFEDIEEAKDFIEGYKDNIEKILEFQEIIAANEIIEE